MVPSLKELRGIMRAGLTAVGLSLMVFGPAGCGTGDEAAGDYTAMGQPDVPEQNSEIIRKKLNVPYIGRYKGQVDHSCDVQLVAGKYGTPDWSYYVYAKTPGLGGMVSWASIPEKTFFEKLKASTATYEKSWSDKSGELNPHASDHLLVVELADGVPLKVTYVKSNMHLPWIKQTVICDQFSRQEKEKL